MTVRELAEELLALSEEEQNLPVVLFDPGDEWRLSYMWEITKIVPWDNVGYRSKALDLKGPAIELD